MSRRGKRGQITVFVLLAIVILFAFMFLLFMKVFIEKNRYQVMATQQVQDYISQNSLSIYVTSCIDSVSTEAVIRASLQGGMINFTNKTLGKDYVTHFVPEYNRTVNVSIAATPNDNCTVVRNSPWEYPYPNELLYPTYLLKKIYDNDTFSCKYSGNIYEYNSGFFGRNQLLKLCNWNGSNKLWATTTEYGVKTCEIDTYSDRKVTSVQQELEHFIEQEIQNCIDFNEVLKRSPSNITQAGAPRAFITFGDDGFNVKVQYPFTVTVRGRQPITAFYDFGVDEPIRFKELYDYAYFSLRSDVQEAGFNMLEDKLVNPDLAKTYRNYDIQRIKSINPSQTDIIRMVDTGTKIDGKPMILQFAIKNRRPALEYINAYRGILGVDLVIQENDSVIITPQGYDPDEDELIYDYRLWKEDYDEVYNTSSDCNPPPDLEYMREHCMIRINSQPHNFTNSTEFQVSKKNARYFPNSSDRGYHELNVTIRENGRQNLTDWQVVKIFVFDRPTANITINNLYSDINGSRASIEDPFILNGSNSLVGLSGTLSEINNDFSSFVWSDSKGNFEKYIEITADRNKTLYLPLDVNGTNSDLPSAIRPYAFATTGWRNISLIVNTIIGLSATAEFEVQVYQCLPHRNNFDYAYPYNFFPYNINAAYQANHTCCSDAYTPKSGECFSQTRYGANSSFNAGIYDYWNRQPLPPAPQPITFSYLGVGRGDNDIFNRTFARNCDGTRGNICGGIARESRTVIAACNDNNYGTGGENRCSGPPIVGTNDFQISNVPLPCVNYTSGTTFELRQKRAQGLPVNPTYDYYCNNTFECSSGGGIGRYNNNGFYLCKASCSGNGQCTTATLCACSHSSCGADQLCDGVAYGFTKDVNTCSAGPRTYIADRCVSCNRQDRPENICRGQSFDASCTAPTECDNVVFGGAANGNNYQWCNNFCAPQTCPNNFAFNGASCETSCNDDTQCRDGYTCCTQEMWTNGECSGASQNSCFEYLPS